MNRNEQISAMLDGELSQADVKTLFPFQQVEDIQTWQNYCAVGDCLRSSDLMAFHSPALLDGIRKALENEPTMLAPVLMTAMTRKNMAQRIYGASKTRQVLASLAAVGFLGYLLNQAVPPVDGQIQMVRVQARENVFTDDELALWQEYFMAHQQNSAQSGLSNVTQIAKVEADRALLDNTKRVIVNNTPISDWMNVWQVSEQANDLSVRFNYVSANR